MAKEKVVAIIQARMGFTRLHGKVLMDISEKPLLWHMVNRLEQSSLIGRWDMVRHAG